MKNRKRSLITVVLCITLLGSLFLTSCEVLDIADSAGDFLGDLENRFEFIIDAIGDIGSNNPKDYDDYDEYDNFYGYSTDTVSPDFYYPDEYTDVKDPMPDFPYETEEYEEQIVDIGSSHGLEYTLNKDACSYSLTGIGTCTDTHVIISSHCNGLPVTAIADSALSNCLLIYGVTIPDTVTSIGRYAFIHCDNLESIEIPDSVTSIEDKCFEFCYSLTSATIGNGVTCIPYQMFYDCNNLESITIPTSVDTIERKAFYNCTNLSNVYYNGSSTDWNNITIKSSEDLNILNSCVRFRNWETIY